MMMVKLWQRRNLPKRSSFMMKHVRPFCDAMEMEVWAWGRGEVGQLGCGDETPRRTPCIAKRMQASLLPRCLAPMQGFPFVSTPRLHHASMLLMDGELTQNGYGTLGLACGLFHSVLLIDGEIWIWGKGDGGRLGLGSEECIYSPTLNPYIPSVQAVSLGGLHSAAVTTQGELYTWGFGAFGQLGHGSYQKELFPKKVDLLQHEKMTYVSAGGAHTAAITASGKLYTWGRDEGEGRLGHGSALVTDEGTIYAPVEVETIPSSVAAVSCGGFFTVALTLEGQVWNWGANSNYELGRGDIQVRTKPSPVPELENIHVIQIAAGGYHSAALTESGKVLTWGHGGHGQLGHKLLSNCRVPQIVEALADKHVIYIACGSSWTSAVTDSGEIFCWGKNRDNQLGIPRSQDSHAVPVKLMFERNNNQVQISKLWSPVAIAAGSCHGICLFRKR